MILHALERQLTLPGELGPIFDFFKDPGNLSELTPPWLNFRVQDASDPSVRAGTRINYRIRWLGLPMRWRSVIDDYQEGVLFADRMVIGPYARWLHLHTFRAVHGGVEVGDRVEYALPMGWLGEMAHRVMVRRQLESIFDYRSAALQRRFGHFR